MEALYKIVIIGPESTGKSTLSAALADHYGTVWCPEYARSYMEQHGTSYNYEDLLIVAKGQLALEDEIMAQATPPYYFIDTDMYVMKVWCEVVFADCHKWILQQAAERKYDHYLLCDTDITWVADGLREYPELNIRRRLFAMYKDLLINSGVTWTLISGDQHQRVEAAVQAIDKRFGFR